MPRAPRNEAAPRSKSKATVLQAGDVVAMQPGDWIVSILVWNSQID